MRTRAELLDLVTDVRERFKREFQSEFPLQDIIAIAIEHKNLLLRKWGQNKLAHLPIYDAITLVDVLTQPKAALTPPAETKVIAESDGPKRKTESSKRSSR